MLFDDKQVSKYKFTLDSVFAYFSINPNTYAMCLVTVEVEPVRHEPSQYC
jgi:hypothetical protein